jgi:hypothetical protein
MKKYALNVLLALFALAFLVPQSRAEVQAGVSIGEDGIQGFYLAIGEFYRAPEKEVVLVRERHVPDDEVPVVFFIARHANTSPQAVIKLRLGGKSWMEISAHFGITADLYYVPVKHDPGPPYGKAYGHYKNKNKSDWKKIVLSDADIVNFVNLRFVSEHYGYSPDEVMKMRGNGKSFVEINGRAKKARDEKMKSQELAAKDNSKGKGEKSKGKGKKK